MHGHRGQKMGGCGMGMASTVTMKETMTVTETAMSTVTMVGFNSNHAYISGTHGEIRM